MVGERLKANPDFRSGLLKIQDRHKLEYSALKNELKSAVEDNEIYKQESRSEQVRSMSPEQKRELVGEKSRARYQTEEGKLDRQYRNINHYGRQGERIKTVQRTRYQEDENFRSKQIERSRARLQKPGIKELGAAEARERTRLRNNPLNEQCDCGCNGNLKSHRANFRKKFWSEYNPVKEGGFKILIAGIDNDAYWSGESWRRCVTAANGRADSWNDLNLNGYNESTKSGPSPILMDAKFNPNAKNNEKPYKRMGNTLAKRVKWLLISKFGTKCHNINCTHHETKPGQRFEFDTSDPNLKDGILEHLTPHSKLNPNNKLEGVPVKLFDKKSGLRVFCHNCASDKTSNEHKNKLLSPFQDSSYKKEDDIISETSKKSQSGTSINRQHFNSVKKHIDENYPEFSHLYNHFMEKRDYETNMKKIKRRKNTEGLKNKKENYLHYFGRENNGEKAVNAAAFQHLVTKVAKDPKNLKKIVTKDSLNDALIRTRKEFDIPTKKPEEDQNGNPTGRILYRTTDRSDNNRVPNRTWAQAVKKAAGSKCAVCGKHTRSGASDHIDPKATENREYLSIEDGQYLCSKHHAEKTVGDKKNIAKSKFDIDHPKPIAGEKTSVYQIWQHIIKPLGLKTNNQDLLNFPEHIMGYNSHANTPSAIRNRMQISLNPKHREAFHMFRKLKGFIEGTNAFGKDRSVKRQGATTEAAVKHFDDIVNSKIRANQSQHPFDTIPKTASWNGFKTLDNL